MLIQITIEIVDEVRLLPNAIFPVSGRRDNGERQTGERRVDQEQSRMYPNVVFSLCSEPATLKLKIRFGKLDAVDLRLLFCPLEMQ
ncbi:hypothetical protein AtEden1_Chr5g0154631 [Arabidopsis thaliana]